MQHGQDSLTHASSPHPSGGPITVVGGGLAGSEAAWQIASAGLDVHLYEMRPTQMTPAHTGSHLAELVCSNSFGSEVANAASEILKTELAGLGGLILSTAREYRVPAGASLAVDREKFSAEVSKRITGHPRITIHRSEIKEIPNSGLVVLATGPLTTDLLCQSLAKRIGAQSLYFYDAISPIVSADSLDFSKMFQANRYDKGETADYWNIPLNKEQYETLVADLLSGEVVLPHDFEEEKYFEGCMPIEAIASRGPKTLAFGPLKPAGLTDPKTGRWPHAVIQLRNENKHGTAFNLVGFQTKLKYAEQLRVFRKLPGLENAEFLRLGSMHRNTYLNSPQVLEPTLQLRSDPRIYIAGQLTGTEGYLESSATGFWAGTVLAKHARGVKIDLLPAETMLGSLLRWITDRDRTHFQPVNSNLGILPPLESADPSQNPSKKLDKKVRNQLYGDRSRKALAAWMSENQLSPPPSPLLLPNAARRIVEQSLVETGDSARSLS